MSLPVNMVNKRFELSSKYIKGKGLELGALQNPLKVSKDAIVIYVDKIDVPTSRNLIYSELKDYELVNVDVLDDGEKLSNIPFESQDFIIANHFLEHTQDPIGTIKTHISKLKVGGILYYAIPDQMGFCDTKRSLTTFEHILNDHKYGPNDSYESHLYEWVGLSQNIPKEKQKEEVERLKKLNYAIHFHVWNGPSFMEFLDKTRVYLNNSFQILEFLTNDTEHIAILKKSKSEFDQRLEDLLKSQTDKPINDLVQVYDERPDLQAAYPETRRGILSNLICWAKNFGVYEDLRLSPHVNFYSKLCMQMKESKSREDVISSNSYRTKTKEGFWMNLDPGDLVISQTIRTTGIWEPVETNFFKEIIKNDMTIIDVGANIGYFTLLFSTLVGSNGKIISFEPSPKNYNILENNVRENKLNNVTSVQKALSDYEGTGKLYLSKNNHGDNRLYDSIIEDDDFNREIIDVEVTYLDKFLQSEKVDMIKIDAQGLELRIINGGLETIKNNPNLTMVIEFWPAGLLAQGIKPNEVILKLQELGFIMYDISDNLSKIDSIDKLCSKYIGKSFTNLYCVKRD